MRLTPDLIGPSVTRNQGIIGEGVDLNLVHTSDLRTSSLALHLTKRLLETKWRDPNEDLKFHLFGKLRNVVKDWLDPCLVCQGGTYPAQLMYQELADMACNRITAAITSRTGSVRSGPCWTLITLAVPPDTSISVRPRPGSGAPTPESAT